MCLELVNRKKLGYLAKYQLLVISVEMAAFGMGGNPYGNPILQNLSAMLYNTNPMAPWGGQLSNKVSLLSFCNNFTEYSLLRLSNKCG